MSEVPLYRSRPHETARGGVFGQGMGEYFTDMCSGSEEGSYLRLVDFVCHSTLGLRVIKKKKEG